MPFKPYTPFEAPEEPSFWDRLGGLPGVLGTGIRAISGVASAPGGPIGATLSGLGEFGAELVEGSTPSWKRIAAEAALGAVPFGGVLKAGRPLASAARGAVYGGVGAAMRQRAQEQEFDPEAIGMSGLIGGAVTGGLSRFLPKGVPPSTAPTTATAYDVIPTAYPGGTVLGGGALKTGAKGKVTLTGAKRMDVSPVPTIRGAGEPVLSEQVLGGAERAPAYTAPLLERPVRPTLQGTFEEAMEKRNLGFYDEQQKALAKAAVAEAKAAVAEAKAARDAATASRIEDAISAGGLEARAPTVAESISTPIEGGRLSMSTRYVAPKAAEVAGAPRPSTMTPELPAVAAPAAVGAAEVIETQPLAQFFRMAGGKLLPSRIDVAGQDYRELQNLFKVYGAGASPDPAELQRIGEAARRGGISLQREARAAGLPTKARAPVPPAAPEVPPTPAAVPDWVKEQTSLAEAGAESPDVLSRIRRLADQEKGAVSQELLTSLGLGIGGAALGAATDPFDDRFLSAVAGGAVGAVAPAALSKLGAAPETLRNLAENIKTPEGLKATASKIWETLPQIQRFNYLADAAGLPANALFGPYGSAMMGALEHGLAGDPRGWAALQSLNPVSFVKEFGPNLDEAAKLIGRAEGRPLSEATNIVETISRTPGTYMTAGDVTARNFLERAGFSVDEARRITLTSEPELPAFRKLANLTKGSPLLQTLLPFTRTPANIAEQGLERLPGVGFFTQAARKTPDPLKQQLIQQGLSLGVGTAAGAIGANLDPEAAKIARRYVTNLGGQYSLPAGLGFAAGQAVRAGKSPVSAAAAKGIRDTLPLPTTETLTDWYKFLSGEGQMPRGLMPPDIKDMLFPAQTTSSVLSGIPRFR